jgi:hypothetical protein
VLVLDIEARLVRGAACVGMLATVSGKMKAVQKIASADGLTLIAERGLDCCCYRHREISATLIASPFGAASSQQEGRPVFS